MNSRIEALKRLMVKKGLKTVLITRPTDVFYYTGFHPGEDQAFLVMGKTPLLIVSELSNEAAAKFGNVVFFKRMKDVTKHLRGRVGFDESSLNTKVYLMLKKSKIKLKPAGEIIKTPRMIKYPKELQFIRNAIKINRKVLKNLVLAGRTEVEIAKKIETQFLSEESEKSFSTIVSSGSNSGFIHHIPNHRKVRCGDYVIVDLGCKFKHYCCDMTRSFYPEEGRQMFSNIKNIQEEIADFVKPGVKFSEIQSLYVKLMEKNKYRVSHVIGHGIGLDVHERPFKEDVIEKNMVITIEPGVYFKNKGCRVEDMFLVTANGVKKL